MKNKDLKELKSKNIEALKKERERLLKEKNEAMIERDMSKTKNYHHLLSIKRSIAQVMTLINEKSFAEKSQKENGQNAS
ncbi:hypothetical protein A2870_00880 [Candidatus Curtissbacteria bacterium RIFCSPHIGHO2_01_FULL_41_11]|uniref:Large ribosomal subunit protein uL29 n=1 Tax=Candidatus Curtissbacteria bacterium RIFCSPHIGHO2_01_FULL_41_11 TaxID=1797711 RepID=A0A1F5G3H1_9BACT|nr:MAG: hypothetical protein A2870_00880 [Candidatus Curtissbacteria bacterium RIFCSPHIGHO2_01_FULL_41_11]